MKDITVIELVFDGNTKWNIIQEYTGKQISDKYIVIEGFRGYETLGVHKDKFMTTEKYGEVKIYELMNNWMTTPELYFIKP